MNISKIKTLIPAPESAFHIELSNDNSQVNCDYNGSPIAGAVYESSVISLWYGASDAWNEFNVTVAASGITHGYNAKTHSLNPSAITADTAPITVTARHKTRSDVVLQATYTLTKNKAGSPGATPVSRSLKPSLHVIRKSSDGSLLDAQISFEVHIRRGTQLTVVSTLGDLYANALDIKIGDTYIGDGSKGSQPIRVATSDFWTNNDSQIIRLEHEVDTEICYDSESIGVVTDGEDGQTAASGLFIPAIIWVEADEDGWSVGDQSFNVTPSVMVEGISCGFEDPLTIVSSPAAVTARYDSTLGIIIISIADSTDPVDYEGEVKVSMEAIVNGKIYPVTKGIPIVANRQGAQGNGIVSITKRYAISNVGTVANDTTEPAHQGSWSAGSPAVTDSYPYLWVKETTVYTDSTKNTTKYYCVGKKGDAGIDGAGSEWVFIRTKTEVAPEICDSEDPSGEDSNGHTYEHDDYLPMVHVTSGEVEANGIAERGAGTFGDGNGEYGECTDDQKGVTETWPFEWIAKRSNVLNGKSRRWESYDTATAANSHKMSLHARYSKDGADGVTYEIIPSVSSIRADADGNILTGVITVAAYKTKSGSRTSCGLGMAVAVGPNGGETDHYWAQYSINGGSWTNCSNISTGSGLYMVMDYGVPGSAVSTITSGIAFRLLYGTSSSYSVVHQIAPLQVVKNGQTGQRGKTGRYYYYDGYFDSTKEYTATDNQAPYVAFDWEDTVTVDGVDTQVTKTSYYMLIAETNKPSGTYIAPRSVEATGVWELMETSFKWLIAEAIFINFAKLGAAIFSGDWMISQHGTINGVASTDYTKFNADDPEGNNAGNFRPNYAVDLLTGEAWLNSAHIRGVVYATSGKFSGEIESEAGHIGGFNIGTSNLTARNGALNITPNGIEFRPSNGSVAWLGATDNVIAAFYSKMQSNYSFACGAQFGAEGASKLNAAIDITKGAVSGYAPIITEFQNDITIVCDNNVVSDSSYTKHVRSGGIFLPVGNSNLNVTLPLSPANGTQYTFIKSNQANTVIKCQGTNKIAVNQKYQDAGTSYTLSAYTRLTIIYSNGYWYGNT